MPVTTRIITPHSRTSRALPPAEARNEPIIAPHATAPETPLLTRRPRLAFTRKPSSGRSGISNSIGNPPRKRENTKPNEFLFRALVLSWPMSAAPRSRPVGSNRRASPFQTHERIRVQRLLVPKQADHNRQTDGGLG